MSDDKVVPISHSKSLIQAGGLIDSSSASLCFYGEDLNPKEISKLLGVEATTSFKKGDYRNTKSKPYQNGAWIYCIEGDAPLGPNDHLKKLLNRITVSREIWRELSSSYKSRISIGIHLYNWNRGFALSTEVITMLEPLGIEVDFDIYADGI